MYLRYDLHAKYYRSDAACLVGSANLTSQALGWSSTPNLEILVHLNATDPSAIKFETDLLTTAVEVDDSLAQTFHEIVSALPGEVRVYQSEEYDQLESNFKFVLSARSKNVWLPLSRYPQHLYKVYNGETGSLSQGAKEAAWKDLVWLAPPIGLSEASFNTLVKAALLQSPIVHELDEFLLQPRRFGEVRDHLRSHLGEEDRDPSEVWQTLMRWLLRFLPSRYRLAVPRYSEVFTE
jgi:hypothetical protein